MRIAGFMLIVSAVGLVAADDAKKEDADSVKGKWSVTSLSHSKQSVEADLIKDLKFVFDDKTYSITGVEPFSEEGNYAIDASKAPNTIDFDIKKGRDEGKQQLGIFKVEGNKLTIVASMAGATERPTSFTIEDGSPMLEIVLEKMKP